MVTAAFPVAIGNRLTQSTAKNVTGGPISVFTVAGRVQIMSIWGEIATAIQNVVVTIKLTANPTTGTDLDLCIATSIQAMPLGSVVGLTGVFTDQLVVPSLTLAGAAYGGGAPFVFSMPGTIDVNTTGAATGQITWYCTWTPMSAAGSVV